MRGLDLSDDDSGDTDFDAAPRASSSASSDGEAGGTEGFDKIERASTQSTKASHASDDVVTERGGGRTVEVTVAILSLHGLVAERNAKSGRKLLRRNGGGGGRPGVDDGEAPRVVASFAPSTSNDDDGAPANRVPSLPVSVTPGSPTGDGDGCDGATRPAVHWPPCTLRFKRRLRCNGGGLAFEPQTCPIDLSILHNGETALLGRADVVVRGDEEGGTPVAIAVESSIRSRRRAFNGSFNGSFNSSFNSSFRVKKWRSFRELPKKALSSPAVAEAEGGEPQRTRRGVPMVAIKGGVYRFGLERPVLRATVGVRDLYDADEGGLGDDRGNGDPVGEDDGVATLRRRLARSEARNEALRGALADERGRCARQRGEIDRLRAQLALASHNAAALLNELGAAPTAT